MNSFRPPTFKRTRHKSTKKQ